MHLILFSPALHKTLWLDPAQEAAAGEPGLEAWPPVGGQSVDLTATLLHHPGGHTDAHADLVLRWKGGAITDLRVPIKRKRANHLRTNEHTVDLVRRLATHYPDAMIAQILTQQGRRTARCLPFNAGRVQSLRHHYEIPCHTPTDDPQEAELLSVTEAAKELGLAPSTLHRWLADGFVAGEQLTLGAPWRIRLTDEIRSLFVDDAPDGWLAMPQATLAYGVSRQTIMQRVKRGELQAVHIRTGRGKGLRIQPPAPQEGLF